MPNILVIRSSATGAASASNQLIDAFLAARGPVDVVTERNLDTDPIPHVTSATLAGIGRPAPETASSQATRDLSDGLIAELQAADVLVLGVPMYNFGMPSTLKSWFDHVLRAGATFRYTAAGPEGLVTGKRAIVVAARAGAYGDAAAVDFQIGHVRTLLGFMGITEVEVVVAEGLAKGAAEAIAAARATLETLARTPG